MFFRSLSFVHPIGWWPRHFPQGSRVGGEIGTATVCSLVAEQSDGSSKWLSTDGANVTLCWWAADRECLSYSSLIFSSGQTIFFIINGSLCDATTPFWTVDSCVLPWVRINLEFVESYLQCIFVAIINVTMSAWLLAADSCRLPNNPGMLTNNKSSPCPAVYNFVLQLQQVGNF